MKQPPNDESAPEKNPPKQIVNRIVKPHSKKRKRNPSQMAADAAFLEHHHLRGKTQAELVGMLAAIRPYRISQQQICADLGKVKRQWQQSAIVQRDVAVAKELAGLQHQENELWAAWEKSKEDRVNVTTEDVALGQTKVKGSKKKTFREGQAGESSYMKLILDIRDQRSKLLGLAAATVIRDSRTPGESVSISGAPQAPPISIIITGGILPQPKQPAQSGGLN